MGKGRAEEQELVEFIMMVQKLDDVGLALLRSNAEMAKEKEREADLPWFFKVNLIFQLMNQSFFLLIHDLNR